MKKYVFASLTTTVSVLLMACGGDQKQSRNNSPVNLPHLFSVATNVSAPMNDAPAATLDGELIPLLAEKNITGKPAQGLDIPSIDSPIAQLGMQLFYSKSLSGEMDTACVTCHHPMMGGGDNLSLGIGVHAVDALIIGPGRRHVSGMATVPRNAPTTFNTALYQQSLFWDSRVEQLDSGIRTPDSQYGFADPLAGTSLLVAQAGFPVTSVEEMRSESFEQGSNNKDVRNHLAARLGGYDGGFGAVNELGGENWADEFQLAFGVSSDRESVVTYNNVARAMAAYQASQIFVDSPWNRFVNGDSSAISDSAKNGAILFFTAKEDGGADCFRCHRGDHFTDESHHVVSFPQIGPGKGDGLTADDDFGLARETGHESDRYKFRTPSLLNVAMTAPYGHAGAYKTLHEVVTHYDNPATAIAYFNNTYWCDDIADTQALTCAQQFPNAKANTELARDALGKQAEADSIESIQLNSREIQQIVSFLETLTDPCVQSRACLAPWIPEFTDGPDGNQLNALDSSGNRL